MSEGLLLHLLASSVSSALPLETTSGLFVISSFFFFFLHWCDCGSLPKAPLKVSESAESKGNQEEEEEEEANRVPFSL